MRHAALKKAAAEAHRRPPISVSSLYKPRPRILPRQKVRGRCVSLAEEILSELTRPMLLIGLSLRLLRPVIAHKYAIAEY